MKVAVLYTPGIWNIGNEFINQGAKQLIKNVFAGGEHEINNIELLETSNLLFNYRTDWTTPYNKNLINNSDLLIVVGGSCLNRYMKHIYDDIAKINIPKIMLGVSFYEDLNKEAELYKNLYQQFDYVFTRDEATYKAISKNKEHKNIINSIDMAFWLQERIPEVIQTENLPIEEYGVVNIDSPENSKMQSDLILDKQKRFKDVYISRNNPRQVGICNNDIGKNNKVFIAEKWYEYLRFYGSAGEVSTNRVHTFLACILLNTPAQFCHDPTNVFARYFLFNRVGMKLDSTKIYREADYQELMERLYELRKNTENKLKVIIDYLKN